MARIMRHLALLAVLALVAGGAGGGTPATLEYRLYREIATPTFTVAGFVVTELPKALGIGLPAHAALAADEDLVRHYLAAAQRTTERPRVDGATADGAAARADRERLEPLVERMLATQVAAILRDEGLGLSGGEVFPPVRFVFRDPPLMLIVSPREQVALRTAVPLAGDLDAVAMAEVEERAERLGVSALVVQIGGLATYPAMLPPAGDVAWLLEAVAHEWVHNYFTVRPLGWRYALGVERDPAVITINETAADLVAREIGRRALRQFYGETTGPHSAAGPPDPRTARFRARMREIRAQVDALLAAGQVEAAEVYMAQQRLALEREGFALRKLNQAYFAFHGSYADGPAGRLDPVVADVKELRARSASLRAFADAVSGVGSAAELRALLVR
ncbi:MAG: hypothetical protein HYU88_01225 [Chloroflexi bacterium]|nr:hypothetical protein [Chloroflexota bacterium]